VSRVLFLDRDGVLNVEGGKHITHPDDLHLLPGAAEAVARLTACNWQIFVYTNQSGVGRGYMTQEDLDAIHSHLLHKIEAAGGKITQIYACPHGPDEDCVCRKPKPGLLYRAALDHCLDLTACYAVGDSARDIEAGDAAGCKTILVLSGHTKEYDPTTFSAPLPDYIFPSLADAADWLCSTEEEE
jgi:D-glycero-D-manno-heptose 1,7-bisphosphate phosphatase